MKKELHLRVRQWLIKGDNDLKTAVDEINTTNPATDTVCFHAQQCVEKYLKGYLTLLNIHAGKTHNLGKLVKMCEKVDSEFKALFEMGVIELNEYAISVRYPDEFYILKIEEAKFAISVAENVKNFIIRKLLEKGYKP